MKNTSFLLLLLFLIPVVSATEPLLECSWKSSCSGPNEISANIFASSQYYAETGGDEVLSSPIGLNQNKDYNWNLCCSSEFSEELSFDQLGPFEFCEGDSLMFFTNETNARIGLKSAPEFSSLVSSGAYSNQLCVKRPDQFAYLDIRVAETDSYYSQLGYTCLYRTNNVVSGLVSSCGATFNVADQYAYTIWARLWESTSSLQCNNDCTSKLDGRVYSTCSQKVNGCQAVPPMCDGSLLEGWVGYNSTHEVQCSSPWNVLREKPTQDFSLEVETSNEDCSNFLSREFSVLVDNEPVTMRVYICSD